MDDPVIEVPDFDDEETQLEFAKLLLGPYASISD